MNATARVSLLQLAGTALYLAAFPAALFALAGTTRWVEGWLFAGWFFLLCTGVLLYLYVRDPALLAERYRRPGSGGQSGWDRAWVYATAAGFVAWIAAMPLDARRFHASPSFPWGLELAGGALLLLSAFFLFRAFRDNTFLSPLVRIQEERKQRVVSSGVYGFVRHPMYLGATCMFFGAPVLLGSLVGLALGLALTLFLAARILGEERLLVRELEGYAEYRQRVRYRLVPFLW
ncbi:MAG TPA: isoprenylcysteine carboxylmethyltransferase family protein [Polyangiaceae bacterium]|jgi:protein-S-isoprenylcysteine O-methyltransferase Ste14